jgi:hypothetical protein
MVNWRDRGNMPRVVTLHQRTSKGIKPVEAAVFTMDGDKVSASYKLKGMKQFFEKDGVTTEKGHFTPKDGRAFYDALPLALSHSSTLSAEDV